VRIAVNRELEILETALIKALDLLAKDARICVISFHSLEDRIVKWCLRRNAEAKNIKILTPKPLTPQPIEVRDNPLSRSAKFRAAQKE
jgi:16S rRNA (cytosine1402-N4)-methyltransferase